MGKSKALWNYGHGTTATCNYGSSTCIRRADRESAQSAAPGGCASLAYPLPGRHKLATKQPRYRTSHRPLPQAAISQASIRSPHAATTNKQGRNAHYDTGKSTHRPHAQIPHRSYQPCSCHIPASFVFLPPTQPSSIASTRPLRMESPAPLPKDHRPNNRSRGPSP